LRQITLQSSPDVQVKTTANATTLAINKGKSFSSETSDETLPFTIQLAFVAGTTYNMTLWPGTLNQAIPSNILTPISYDSTTNRFIKLSVTSNGKSITGTTVASSATVTDAITTTADAAPTTFDILIGVIVAGTIYQVRRGNLLATLNNNFTEGKAVPVPGTSPYTFYYTWLITQDDT
jgi:hypothetical protein